MAVRLILVALVLVSLSLAAAQQSEGTGGRTVDRRLNIRRFSARRKAEGAQKRKRPGATEEELARRKLLFERNRINRKRPAAASATERATTSRPVTERRIQSSRTFRPRTRPDNFVRPNNEVEAPVVRISNNDREIQDLVLKGRQEEQEDERERTPFQGTSAVGTVSQPSGFRSSNEQIVRVSFKKPNEKPAKQDALEALLRTVNKKVETPSSSNFVDNTGLSVQQKAAVREMEQDDREAEALEERKRLRAEENEVEGGRQRFRSFPSRSGSRANPPRRRPQGGESSGARRDRVRTRGRGQTRLRTTAAPATTTEAAFAEDLTLPPGLSFPTAPTAAPQPAPEAPRSAFTLDQSFGAFTDKFFPATQPSVPARAPAPTQAPAPRAPLPAPVPAQRFPQRIEPGQQTFQQPAAPAQQTFRPVQTFQPGQQQQPVQQQAFQQFQPQPVQQPRPAQTFQQAAPVQQQNFQPQQQQQQPGAFPSLVQLRQLQNTQAQPAQQSFQPQPVQQQPQQTFQPQQRFQPQAAAPQQLTAAQATVFGANPFNLINTNNNFAQFDAQFGGSVPEAPGAAQLSSQIFSQPQQQAAPRQQPFTAFGSTAQQGVSVFGR